MLPGRQLRCGCRLLHVCLLWHYLFLLKFAVHRMCIFPLLLAIGLLLQDSEVMPANLIRNSHRQPDHDN